MFQITEPKLGSRVSLFDGIESEPSGLFVRSVGARALILINCSNAVRHSIDDFVEERRRKGSILHKVR